MALCAVIRQAGAIGCAIIFGENAFQIGRSVVVKHAETEKNSEASIVREQRLKKRGFRPLE